MSKIILPLFVFLFSCIPTLSTQQLDRIHVQIARKTGDYIVDVASGSILRSKEGLTYVLTAKHVLRKDVDIYIKEDLHSVYRKASIKAIHNDYDAVILTYKGSFRARSVSIRWTNDSIHKGDPIAFVGSPKGIHQSTKIGLVLGMCKEVPICSTKGKAYVLNTASDFGFSGGGVYRYGILVGLNTSVFVDFFNRPTRGVFLSLEDLGDWIRKNVY